MFQPIYTTKNRLIYFVLRKYVFSEERAWKTVCLKEFYTGISSKRYLLHYTRLHTFSECTNLPGQQVTRTSLQWKPSSGGSAHLCTHKILTNSFVTLPKTLANKQRRLPNKEQQEQEQEAGGGGQEAGGSRQQLPGVTQLTPCIRKCLVRWCALWRGPHTKYGYNCTLSIRITA